MSVVLTMKTYGRIHLDAQVSYIEARDNGQLIDYEVAKRIADEALEAGAQAVIEEFKRRNGIEDKSATG